MGFASDSSGARLRVQCLHDRAPLPRGCEIKTVFVALLLPLVLAAAATNIRAAVPPAEKILPADTLLVISTPDFSKLSDVTRARAVIIGSMIATTTDYSRPVDVYSRLNDLLGASARVRVWSDPAMRPFRDNFMAKCRSELLDPLEHETGARVDDLLGMFEGQVTLAITRNGWEDRRGQRQGLLLLVDSRDKSGQLRTNLALMKQKWLDTHRAVRTEQIRGFDFLALGISPEDIPKAILPFLPPRRSPPSEGGSATESSQAAPGSELYIGQVDSLLIIGSGRRPVERVVTQLTGGAAPALESVGSFQADNLALFRNASLYGWLNARALLDGLAHQPAPADGAAPDDSMELGVSPAISSGPSYVSGLGLAGLRSVAFSFTDTGEGSTARLFIGAPVSTRAGLLKILAGEARSTAPPAFVPADAVRFRRWRLDAPQSWDTLAKSLQDASPSLGNTLSFFIASVNLSIQQQSPKFEFRRDLIGNMGDDFISYEKRPRGDTLAELRAPPSITLIGSPEPERLAAAMTQCLTVLGSRGAPPDERDFMGRKIYSVQVPSTPIGPPPPGSPMTVTLSYAAGSGYLAMSVDTGMIEEFLRSGESKAHTLAESRGFKEAAQHVMDPNTSMFGFDNERETMRAEFEVMRKDTNAMRGPVFIPVPGIPEPTDKSKSYRSWLDYRLLPDFDRVAKYYNTAVFGAGAGVDGITFKSFTPAPPDPGR
jgi:hypothetical protein